MGGPASQKSARAISTVGYSVKLIFFFVNNVKRQLLICLPQQKHFYRSKATQLSRRMLHVSGKKL